MANFIWYELLTDDAGAAQAFYAAVIGWQVGDSGMTGIDYRIFATPEGEAIGGLMQRPEDGRASRSGSAICPSSMSTNRWRPSSRMADRC